MRRAVVCCLLLNLLAATPRVATGGTVTWSFGAGDAATRPKSITCSGSKIVAALDDPTKCAEMLVGQAPARVHCSQCVRHYPPKSAG